MAAIDDFLNNMMQTPAKEDYSIMKNPMGNPETKFGGVANPANTVVTPPTLNLPDLADLDKATPEQKDKIIQASSALEDYEKLKIQDVFDKIITTNQGTPVIELAEENAFRHLAAQAIGNEFLEPFINMEGTKLLQKKQAKQALVNQAVSGKMAQQAQEAIFDRQAYKDTLKAFRDSLGVYEEAHKEGRLTGEGFATLSKAIQEAELDFVKAYRAGNRDIVPKSIGLIEMETGVKPTPKPYKSKIFGIVAEDGTMYYKVANQDYMGNLTSIDWVDDKGQLVTDHRLKQSLISQSSTSSFYIGDTPYMGPSTFGALAGLSPSMVGQAYQGMTKPKTSTRSSSTVTRKGAAVTSPGAGVRMTPGTSGGAVGK